MPKLDACPVVNMAVHGIGKDKLIRLAESGSMLPILELLACGPSNYSNLYEKLNLNPKSLVSLLNELVKNGFVKKIIVHHKPKAVSYSITVAGRKTIFSTCPFLKCNARTD